MSSVERIEYPGLQASRVTLFRFYSCMFGQGTESDRCEEEPEETPNKVDNNNQQRVATKSRRTRAQQYSPTKVPRFIVLSACSSRIRSLPIKKKGRQIAGVEGTLGGHDKEKKKKAAFADQTRAMRIQGDRCCTVCLG